MCSYKSIMFSPGKFMFSLLHPSLQENLMCSRNLFKKVTPGEKEQIFYQNNSPAASDNYKITSIQRRSNGL